MSEGPARIAVSIRTQKDKYGPGVDYFIGADNPEELEVSLTALIGDEAKDQVFVLAQQQVAIEHGRLVGGAVENLQAAGLVQVEQPVAAGPGGAAPFTPAPASGGPWGGGGQQAAAPSGGDNNEYRILGVFPGSDSKVFARWNKFDPEKVSVSVKAPDGKNYYANLGKGVPLQAAELNAAVAALKAKNNWQ